MAFATIHLTVLAGKGKAGGIVVETRFDLVPIFGFVTNGTVHIEFRTVWRFTGKRAQCANQYCYDK
jgi:hypothetical protein